MTATLLDLAIRPRSSLVPCCAYCGLDVYEEDDGTIRQPGIADADDAVYCEKSADHLHSAPVDPPVHVCYEGPLCAFWDDGSHPFSSPDDDVIYCGHQSCMLIAQTPCEACMIETTIEAAADVARWADLGKTLDTGICPGPAGRCGAPVEFRAQIAAPGYGSSYECAAGHVWVRVGPDWTDAAPELSISDVI